MRRYSASWEIALLLSLGACGPSPSVRGMAVIGIRPTGELALADGTSLVVAGADLRAKRGSVTMEAHRFLKAATERGIDSMVPFPDGSARMTVRPFAPPKEDVAVDLSELALLTGYASLEPSTLVNLSEEEQRRVRRAAFLARGMPFGYQERRAALSGKPWTGGSIALGGQGHYSVYGDAVDDDILSAFPCLDRVLPPEPFRMICEQLEGQAHGHADAFGESPSEP